ncbi:MAG: class I SAM-dependent methyltransferase [Sterolibacterium sp.]
MFDALVFGHDAHALAESAEFALGLRELTRRVAPLRWWFSLAGKPLPGPSDFHPCSAAEYFLVILNPAILVSDGLVEELQQVLESGNAVTCALPSDQRGFAEGVSLDYATRPGFDRFVRRLGQTQPRLPYDGRAPWAYLVARSALEDLPADSPPSWETLPAYLKDGSVIAQRAYVHSYGDYYLNTRSEMLDLIPAEVESLLDVGGGEGGFAQVFIAQRGRRAVVAEQNPRAALAARGKGIEVREGSFDSCSALAEFDCVSFLDVLEHIADPLAALQQARAALRPGGWLLLSVPNVGHWAVVWDLLGGLFEYQPVGILCNTHLRFYSRYGLRTLLEDCGFRVERWDDVESPIPTTFQRFLDDRPAPGVAIDAASLATSSFNVLARRD